jgi:dipeptidase
VRNIIKSVLNEINQKQNKPNLIKECTIAAVRIDDGVVLAKNRDRGYKARVEIIHELIDDVEIVYWRDIDTDWSEGMNEFGIGILNSSLLVAQDEKEGREVDKKRLKNDKTETKINSYDGEKIRKALTYKTLPKVIKSIISFRGGDQKDVGVKGETIVSDNRNIYVVELTSKHSPIIKKLNQDSKLVVRTNHGIYQKGAGYTRGEKRKSSLIRMELAKNHLKNVKKDLDVINVMKKKYKKDPFLNPYRTKNMYHMQTTGQIMMNLEKKIVLVRMDNEMGEFVGIKNKLPKNYEPKIKIKVESEKTHDKGKKLPT